MSKRKKLKILLVDDHRIVRKGLQSLLEKYSELEIIGEAENGHDAVRMCEELHPDIVIMDIAMPGLNGFEATKQILGIDEDIKIIALSVYAEKQFIKRMLSSGASGYLIKDCALDELYNAINTVVQNKIFLSEQISELVVEDYISHLFNKNEIQVKPTLTDREREVLQLLAEGNSTREAARKLHISIKTIETHRQHIYEKLDLHSTAELTKYAIREGITPLEA